jgi:hypothetical protein
LDPDPGWIRIRVVSGSGLDPDRYSAQNAGSGSVPNEYGSETLIKRVTGTYISVWRLELAVVLLDPHLDEERLGRTEVRGDVRPHGLHVLGQKLAVRAAQQVVVTGIFPSQLNGMIV